MRDFITSFLVWCALAVILASAAQAVGIAYESAVTGIEDPALLEAFESESLLHSLSESPPTTLSGLRRRVRGDVEVFENILRAHGYFNAVIETELDETFDPVKVEISVDPGQAYVIREFEATFGVEALDGELAFRQAREQLVFPVGAVINPDDLARIERDLLAIAFEHGHPFASITGRRLAVDHDDHSVSVRIRIDAGQESTFGAVKIAGLDKVDEAFIRRRIAWKEGEVFDTRKIARTRRDLLRSGVISTANITYENNGGGALPVTITLRESKHRSVGAGAFYTTSSGPYGQLFWEHRNIFGQAERLRLTLDLGTERYGVGASITKPDFMGRRSLSLRGDARYKYEELEAYDRATIGTSGSVHWTVNSRFSVSGGIGLERSEITETGRRKQTFSLVSFPFTGQYDSTNDLLDPSRGIRLRLGITPYQSIEEPLAFIIADATASHYWGLSPSLVWANRARIASVQGQGVGTLPADKRLYAGGAGSVRGYGYQMLGPLNAAGKPQGGRFLTEASTELRYRFSENIGAVGFIEAGRLTEDSAGRQGTESFLYSAGLGGRYYTAVGPIRVDVAVPLNRRKQDSAYQLYISLGQAF